MKIRLDPSEFVGEDAVQPGDQLDVSGLGMLHGVAPGLYRVRSVDAEAQEVELELAYQIDGRPPQSDPLA